MSSSSSQKKDDCGQKGQKVEIIDQNPTYISDDNLSVETRSYSVDSRSSSLDFDLLGISLEHHEETKVDSSSCRQGSSASFLATSRATQVQKASQVQGQPQRRRERDQELRKVACSPNGSEFLMHMLSSGQQHK